MSIERPGCTYKVCVGGEDLVGQGDTRFEGQGGLGYSHLQPRTCGVDGDEGWGGVVLAEAGFDEDAAKGVTARWCHTGE
jgi:hypothetical protein